MALVAAATAIVGGLSQAGAAAQSAQAASQADQYNQAVNQQDANLYLSEGKQIAIQDERQKNINEGQVVAAAGASGMMNSGSAMDVLADVAQQGELQKQWDVMNAKAKAMGYQSTAQLDTMASAQATNTGQSQASGALLGSVSSAATTLGHAGYTLGSAIKAVTNAV